jgi:hypothetical protein
VLLGLYLKKGTGNRMGKLINIIGYKLMFSAKYHLMYEKKLLLNSFHSINFNLFL